MTRIKHFDRRADIELNYIRAAVRDLPTGLRHSILNRCDKLAVLYRKMPAVPETDNRTSGEQAEQVAEQYNTAQRILAALLAGRIVSQRDSAEFKTTAFHSRMADVRRIVARQYPGRTLCSRYTEDHHTAAGRPYKLYWLV